ncbi:MAG: TonB-dependent receptor [Bacteroidetes bacterium]|nr:TonB-dependent receptor [Fibrella sp.]
MANTRYLLNYPLLIALLLATNQLFGQTASVRGVVQDTRHRPVPFSTVMLLNAADSALVKAQVSSDSGTYAFTALRAGAYRISVTGVGYTQQYSEPVTLADGQALVLATLQLAEVSSQLSEVKVVARKPLLEIMPDKTVLNVDASITAAGSSALELLQKAPGVLVDPSDNIVLQGKNGTRVYIDGKLSPLTQGDLAAYLRTLLASDIEAIEIIAHPSARYDAAGNAGIINIRLKKNKNFGTNGSVALGLAQGRFYPKQNGSVALNHRTKGANIFANYSNRMARDWSFINFYRQQAGMYYDQKAETVTRSAAHNLKAGADFFLGSKSTLGVLVNANGRNSDSETDGRTPIGPLNQPATSVLIANNRNTGNRANLTANLNYQYTDTSGRTLNVDADYGRYTSAGNNYQPNQYRDPTERIISQERNYRMKTSTVIDLYTLKADYQQKLWRGKLSAGFKLSSVETGNDFNFFDVTNGRDALNTDRTNQFSYTERVGAGYASYERQVKKFQWQAGLRLEQTYSHGVLSSVNNQADGNVERTYLNLFPSAGLTYSANADNRYSVVFSRRIDRPGYQDLNPFESKLDELTYQKGNAFLRPQYTNSVEVSRTYKYTLTTTLGFSRTTDFFTSITDTTEGNRNFITTRNLARQDVISLGVSYPFSVAKWWNVYASLTAYHSNIRADFGEGKTIDLNANVLSLYSQHTITLPRKWSLEVSGYYTSPSIWGGTFINRRYWGSTVGVSHKVLRDKGSLALTLTDPFNSQRWRGVSQFGGLYMIASGGYESRQARINFTYNFGSKQVKGARQRNAGSADESKRIN